MTKEEKLRKIETAKSDIKTLEELLDKFDLKKSNSVVSKVTQNIDYTEAIVASRIANNVPFGNLPYGSLEFPEKIKVLKMLLAAVKSALTVIIATPVDSDSETQ